VRFNILLKACSLVQFVFAYNPRVRGRGEGVVKFLLCLLWLV